MNIYDTIIIGGGQAGLAVGFYLRRHQLNFLIVDDQTEPGGAWLHTWDSLKLFSPSTYSGLPGWQMPTSQEKYPTKQEFINYLKAYEARYQFPIKRDSRVLKVEKEGELFKIVTNHQTYYSKTLVSATGTAQKPHIPQYKNQDLFKGIQYHSIDYKNARLLKDKTVMVIGGGNSAAQILAEVSKVTFKTIWVTRRPPEFLPEHIDGRYLFEKANEAFYIKSTRGLKEDAPAYTVNQIVQIEEVVKAKEREVFKDRRPFREFTSTGVVWEDGQEEQIDVVIWCTGFKANLSHLDALELSEGSRIPVNGTKTFKEPNLWLVGYGHWTGYASATIYGVGKTARQTALEIKEELIK